MSDHTMFLDFGLFSIYWFGFIMGIAVLLSTGLFVLLRKMQGEDAESSMTIAIIAMPTALIMSRIFYCWFAKALFSDGAVEMMNLLTGGYAFYGALSGVLAVVLIEGFRRGTSVPAMLDAVCPPVVLAVAVERWAGMINGSDIGFSVSSPWIKRFPFALMSEADQKFHLWVGFFEGATAVMIFLFLTAVFLVKYRWKRGGLRCGDVALLFMMTYGFSQSFWESMRDDSLFMVTLGFVRISQIISIVMAISAVVFLIIRKIRSKGISVADAGQWVLCAAALGVAVYCEFTMNAVSMTRNYILLGLSLSSMLVVGLGLMFGSRKHRMREISARVPRESDRRSAGMKRNTSKKESVGFDAVDTDGLDIDILKSLH